MAVAGAAFELDHEAFELVAYGCSGRQPEGQAGPELLVEREQVEVLADVAVVDGHSVAPRVGGSTPMNQKAPGASSRGWWVVVPSVPAQATASAGRKPGVVVSPARRSSGKAGAAANGMSGESTYVT